MSISEDQLWRACEPLREEGMAISKYVEQLTGLLFLKSCSVSGKVDLYNINKYEDDDDEDDLYLPKPYRWDYISGKENIRNYEVEDEFEEPKLPKNEDKKISDLNRLELYEEAIEHLKRDGELAQRGFDQFTSRFDRLSTFKDTVDHIENLDGWDKINEEISEDADIFGDMYEYILEKYADKAEGAGEYFTPRGLIKAMVEFRDPAPEDEVIDPAAGTNGFLIETYKHISEEYDLEEYPDIEENFHTREIRGETYRIGLINYILHGVGPTKINAEKGNSLIQENEREREFDMVLANPPFGSNVESTYSKKGDSTIEAQFLLMMMDMLNENGEAAIIVPEGILFDSSKSSIREDLLNNYNIECILSLPENTFHPYAGVDANVLFFERDEDGTDGFWYYDARTDFDSINESNPIKYEKHLSDFIQDKNNKEENEKYFKVDVDEVDQDNYELHLKKYKEFKYEGHRPPSEIAQDIKDELTTIETELDQMVGEKNDQ